MPATGALVFIGGGHQFSAKRREANRFIKDVCDDPNEDDEYLEYAANQMRGRNSSLKQRWLATREREGFKPTALYTQDMGQAFLKNGICDPCKHVQRSVGFLRPVAAGRVVFHNLRPFVADRLLAFTWSVREGLHWHRSS